MKPVEHWIRVVESPTSPRVRYRRQSCADGERDGKPEGMEPIAGRIIELSEDEEQNETLRNPHSGWVVYVPPGSVRKRRGPRHDRRHEDRRRENRAGQDDGVRHVPRPNLTGVVGADVPPIAGRSPSYLARQLWDIQQGTRNGAQAQLMKLVVANLSHDDLDASRPTRLTPQNAPQTAAPVATN